MTKALVKICCITSVQEAQLALEAGANLLGLVSKMPSGPGVISLNSIASIVACLPFETNTVLLTSRVTASAIIEQHQLVDCLPMTELVALRSALPGVELIQVIHVQNQTTVKTALEVEPYVDMLLLDSGKPDAHERSLGGSGMVHDWSISREICRRVNMPVLLAGGLNYKNVGTAYKTVLPAGVDVCSGVRVNSILDERLLTSFVQALHVAEGHPEHGNKKRFSR